MKNLCLKKKPGELQRLGFSPWSHPLPFFFSCKCKGFKVTLRYSHLVKHETKTIHQHFADWDVKRQTGNFPEKLTTKYFQKTTLQSLDDGIRKYSLDNRACPRTRGPTSHNWQFKKSTKLLFVAISSEQLKLKPILPQNLHRYKRWSCGQTHWMDVTCKRGDVSPVCEAGMNQQIVLLSL